MTLETIDLVLIGVTGLWFLGVGCLFGCLALVSATLSPERYRTNFGDAMRSAFASLFVVLVLFFILFFLRLLSPDSTQHVEPLPVTVLLRVLLVGALAWTTVALWRLMTAMVGLIRERVGGEARLSILLWEGLKASAYDLISRGRRPRRQPADRPP